MFSTSTSTRALVPAVILSLATAAMLTGCTPAAPNAPVGGAAEPGSSAPAATSTPAVPDEPDAAADPYATISSYYPVAKGNTWTYEMKLGKPIGTVTETETMTKLEPEGDGVRVTIERSYDYGSSSIKDMKDSVVYVFHKDGSLEVPYQSLPTGEGATVTVKKGNLLWPTTDEFESKVKKKGTITASIKSSTGKFDEKIAFTIQGKGTKSVTVPFGTFDARVLDQSLSVSIPKLGVKGISIRTTSWLAEGVGMVKTEVPGPTGGKPITVELVKFTPGS